MKSFALIFAMIIFWQLLCSFNLINSNIIPSPGRIISTAINEFLDGKILLFAVSSLKRILIGFSVAALFGCTLGILMGTYRGLKTVLEPLIEVLRPIPPIAWIPIAIIIFGLGDFSSYFIVFIGAFFPIFTSTLFGAVSIPEKYINLVSSLQIKKVSYFRKILIPFSLPYIFSGLKIGIGMAWMSVIASEMIGAQSGLGYYIQVNRLLLETDKIIVGMIFIGLLGYGLVTVVSLLENKIIHWRIK